MIDLYKALVVIQSIKFTDGLVVTGANYTQMVAQYDATLYYTYLYRSYLMYL